MHTFKKSALTAAIALTAAQTVFAGSAPFFVPLTKQEIVEPADSIDERNAPWSVPYGVSFRNLTSMEEVETSVGQSIVRANVGLAGRSTNVASMFDMLAYDPTGNYIFIPHETPLGAGVSRYDVVNDVSEVLFKGDETGVAGFKADTDFGAFDPVRWTPNDTLIAGEEWSGTGRLVEICDPYGPAPVDPTSTALTVGNCENDPNADYRILDRIPLVGHEGIVFSLDNPDTVMYYVDEDRSGSIYKTVFANPGELNSGQHFVLSVNDFIATGGDASARWDRSPNTGVDASGNALPGGVPSREGQATWVPITDVNGNPLPGVQNPYENILDENDNIVDPGEAGEQAANDVNGTPYGRPEDATISRLANGNEVIYIAVTSENSVIGIEETATGPVVRYFVTPNTPINAGFASTNATLNAPDNLAVDSLGNIYVIEDSPNTTTVGADGGDIWFAQDKNNDGVAESIHHFMSLQVNQSEATGMIFHPTDPTKFVVAVQHPASTGLADLDNDGVRDVDASGNPVTGGFGDAIWEFDLSGVQPPKCEGPRSAFMSFNPETGRWVRACSTQRDFNAVSQIIQSESDTDFPTP